MNPTTAMVIAGVAFIKGVPRDRYLAFVAHTWDDVESVTMLIDAWNILHSAVEEDHRDE